MVIEAFVYLEKRLKEDDDFRQKFDSSNILKRKGRAPRTTDWFRLRIECTTVRESLKICLGALITADQIHINPAQEGFQINAN